MKYKAIVFDFDGVITKRGEALKDEAWDRLEKQLEPEEETRREEFVVALRSARAHYGQGKAKGSRYDIIRDALSAINTTLVAIKDKTDRYADQYNLSVQEMILEDGVYPETQEGLIQLSSQNRLYVNSATPTEGVQESLERLGLKHYFVKILGQPQTKLENLIQIAKDEDASPAEIIFVGDSSGDEKAAQEFGCSFVGVTNDWNHWKDKQYPLISRLTDIALHL